MKLLCLYAQMQAFPGPHKGFKLLPEAISATDINTPQMTSPTLSRLNISFETHALGEYFCDIDQQCLDSTQNAAKSSFSLSPELSHMILKLGRCKHEDRASIPARSYMMLQQPDSSGGGGGLGSQMCRKSTTTTPTLSVVPALSAVSTSLRAATFALPDLCTCAAASQIRLHTLTMTLQGATQAQAWHAPA